MRADFKCLDYLHKRAHKHMMLTMSGDAYANKFGSQ